MGTLILTCEKTGRAVDTHCTTDRKSLSAINPLAQINVRCPACGEVHKFVFSDATIRKDSDTLSAHQRRGG
jgi:phage FluMu protein Com